MYLMVLVFIIYKENVQISNIKKKNISNKMRGAFKIFHLQNRASECL